MTSVVVVGASMGGLRVAQALRRHGHEGSITLIGEERHLPYDRPPLSKAVLLGETEPVPSSFVTAADLDAAQISFMGGTSAVALHPDDGVVELDDGRRLGYDDIVIATGSRAVTPFQDPPPGVHTLRTFDDAQAIRERMGPGRQMVVVGAGFIGLEVASSALDRGMATTVLEAAEAPLTRVLDRPTAEALSLLATSAGVHLRTGVTVTGFAGDDRVEAVCLADGTTLEADLVVVGVGSAPNTAWLGSSGLPLTPAGVTCSPGGRVDGYEHVWAVGDVAGWRGQDGHPKRREHWTSVIEQADVVARNILGPDTDAKLTGADYVWSEQFGHKINIVGSPHTHDEKVVLSSNPQTLAVLYAQSGHLLGACVVGQMSLVLKCRRWIAAGVPVAEIEPWAHAAN